MLTGIRNINKTTRINTSFPINTRIYTCYDIYAKGKRYQDLPMTAKQMIKYLKHNVFHEVPRGGGSHRKFYNPDTGKTTIVPTLQRFKKAWSKQY